MAGLLSHVNNNALGGPCFQGQFNLVVYYNYLVLFWLLLLLSKLFFMSSYKLCLRL